MNIFVAMILFLIGVGVGGFGGYTLHAAREMTSLNLLQRQVAFYRDTIKRLSAELLEKETSINEKTKQATDSSLADTGTQLWGPGRRGRGGRDS